jgi:hypothetical protein
MVAGLTGNQSDRAHPLLSSMLESPILLGEWRSRRCCSSAKASCCGGCRQKETAPVSPLPRRRRREANAVLTISETQRPFSRHPISGLGATTLLQLVLLSVRHF